MTGWTADGARGGLDFPSSRMQVRTRTVQCCTLVLAELPMANCRGLGHARGGKGAQSRDQSLHLLWAPAKLPQGYPTLPSSTWQLANSQPSDRRGSSRLGRHGLSTRPSTHATGTAASFAQALQAVPCSSREQTRAGSIVCRLLPRTIQHADSCSLPCLASLLSYCGSLYCVPPLHCFSSVQQLRQRHFEARNHENQRRKTTRHALTGDVTKREVPGPSSNFVI